MQICGNDVIISKSVSIDSPLLVIKIEERGVMHDVLKKLFDKVIFYEPDCIKVGRKLDEEVNSIIEFKQYHVFLKVALERGTHK